MAADTAGGIMGSGARLFGHPIHQMLIVFPLGLLATSAIFDIIGLATNDGKWHSIAFYMIAAGVVGGLAAAIFGLIDYLAIPGGTRAKRVGLLHGLGNLVVVVLFALSWYVRMPDPMAPLMVALLCSFAGVLLALITGWLGGELVDQLGIGVTEGANPNAPSSLSGRTGTGRKD